jgi:hypothetical protein
MSTRAEQETLFRWDDEGRVLWACTASPLVMRRWQKAGLPVTVLGTEGGEPRTWEVTLDAVLPTRWLRAFSEALETLTPRRPGPARTADAEAASGLARE